MKKDKSKKLSLFFSKEELNDRRVIGIIKELVEIKINIQRYNDFISISPAEFEVISKFTEFVPKDLYKCQVSFKGEVGKIKGKRVIVNDDN